jgi:hypothetical protein
LQIQKERSLNDMYTDEDVTCFIITITSYQETTMLICENKLNIIKDCECSWFGLRWEEEADDDVIVSINDAFLDE